MAVDLKDQVVLVTGGGSGIGQCAALALAGHGAKVAVSDMNIEGARQTLALIEDKHPGTKTTALVCNVTKADDCVRVVAETESQLGPIRVLVSNAGVGHSGTALETSEENWDLMMNVNAKGMFLMAKAVLPGMIERKSGSIVNTASLAGLVAVPERAGYCASKFAVVGLTRAMARDHAKQGIRINCVCPGTIDTPWIQERMAQSEDPEATRAAMVARQPLGRMGTPEEIADAIVYLATSDYSTGTALLIDGGYSA